MRSLRSRRPLTRVLLILSLLLPTILTTGLLATPALADMPGLAECDYDGYTKPETIADGTIVYWICHVVLKPNGKVHRYWSVGPIVPGPWKGVNKASARTDSYTRLNVAIAQGNSNGDGVVSYQLYTADSIDTMFKQIQVRLIIMNRTTGGTCADTNWQGPSSAASHATIEAYKNLPVYCGGSGYFEVMGNGRWYSSSLGWIATGWVNSGQLFLQNCCAPANRSPSSPPTTKKP